MLIGTFPSVHLLLPMVSLGLLFVELQRYSCAPSNVDWIYKWMATFSTFDAMSRWLHFWESVYSFNNENFLVYFQVTGSATLTAQLIRSAMLYVMLISVEHTGAYSDVAGEQRNNADNNRQQSLMPAQPTVLLQLGDHSGALGDIFWPLPYYSLNVPQSLCYSICTISTVGIYGKTNTSICISYYNLRKGMCRQPRAHFQSANYFTVYRLILTKSFFFSKDR